MQGRLKRDEKTKALLNIDDQEYQRHLMERKRSRDLLNMKEAIDKIQRDLDAIKKLMGVHV